MKRIYPVVTLFLMLFLLAACGPDQPEVDEVEPTAVSPTTAPAENDTNSRPTVTPVANDGYPVLEHDGALDGYPAVIAVTAVSNDGYPDIDYSALPTRNPYPVEGEHIWMSVPMGEQCAEPIMYPTMQDAVLVLLSEGIAVFDQRTDNLMVCSACGCPTSIHYSMKILATDQAEAEELGWQLSEEQ